MGIKAHGAQTRSERLIRAMDRLSDNLERIYPVEDSSAQAQQGYYRSADRADYSDLIPQQRTEAQADFIRRHAATASARR